jgi:hypothetical protein
MMSKGQTTIDSFFSASQPPEPGEKEGKCETRKEEEMAAVKKKEEEETDWPLAEDDLFLADDDFPVEDLFASFTADPT